MYIYIHTHTLALVRVIGDLEGGGDAVSHLALERGSEIGKRSPAERLHVDLHACAEAEENMFQALLVLM